jgi:hypothetical protein
MRSVSGMLSAPAISNAPPIPAFVVHDRRRTDQTMQHRLGEQGTNNRTFLVRHRQQRYVLRVSGFLSVAEVRAEHRILRRLRQGRAAFPSTPGHRPERRWFFGLQPDSRDIGRRLAAETYRAV